MRVFQEWTADLLCINNWEKQDSVVVRHYHIVRWFCNYIEPYQIHRNCYSHSNSKAVSQLTVPSVSSNVIAVPSKRLARTCLAGLLSDVRHLVLLCSCNLLTELVVWLELLWLRETTITTSKIGECYSKSREKCEGCIQMFSFAPGVTPLLKCHGTKEK